MPFPIIRLVGKAILGKIVNDRHRQAVSTLSPEVRLGCLPPEPEQQRKLVYLDDFYEPSARGIPLPTETNWRERAAVPLARMYMNDKLGCCVWSGKAHALGVWSANDSDAGGIVEATDNEIVTQYQGVCGPQDAGCVITRVLDYMMQNGMLAGGKRYFLDGYAAVAHTNKDLVRAVAALGGASTIGIQLPASWTKEDIWDVTSSQILGGHDVTPVDVTEEGVIVSSWGRLYTMTWRAFLSSRWVTEFYFLLSPLWYGPDKLSPSGFNEVELRKALATFKAGGLPDLGGGGPTPPAPSAGRLFDLDFTAMGGRKRGQQFQGTAKILRSPRPIRSPRQP